MLGFILHERTTGVSKSFLFCNDTILPMSWESKEYRNQPHYFPQTCLSLLASDKSTSKAHDDQ